MSISALLYPPYSSLSLSAGYFKISETNKVNTRNAMHTMAPRVLQAVSRRSLGRISINF